MLGIGYGAIAQVELGHNATIPAVAARPRATGIDFDELERITWNGAAQRKL